MNFVTLMLLAAIILLIAYFSYGRFLERRLRIDPERPTPAHTMGDGKEFVATKTPVLFGHHFTTIAGGGPITGPIAAIVFGWVPAVVWIIIGSIFIGGVHDYASLQASVRHKARSIGGLIHQYMGARGQLLFLSFAIATLILIVGVFIILVANTFVSFPGAATASLLFITAAIIFGILINQLRLNLVIATMIGVTMMACSIWIGLRFPLELSATTWSFLLIAYAYAASVLPVWFLLQPRDYLNSFLLYALIGGAFIGILVARPTIQMPAFTGFYNETLGFLFPILFITIACGAISGFHSLVSSGTTSKQLQNEKSGRLITYGSMLLEAFIAIIAIGSVAYLTMDEFSARLAELGDPISVFSAGMGAFMGAWGLPIAAGTTFAALTASAFLMTTLDSATRLMRYTISELGEGQHIRFLTGKHTATVIGLSGATLLALTGTWQTVWPLFGAANQMLGALALLAITLWLVQMKVKSTFVVIPMIFMFLVTTSALLVMIYMNVLIHSNYFLAIIAFILFSMCIFLAIEAFRSVKKHT
ncbi:carbon starvation CstA family protein [Shouchella lonarensis]|uniref:Carbon starvation protein n=1 Tax=Shouchella lonarensis TaxID=1464122 RepID=A0A1G6GJC5_9BACI|nr:carbon starvation protein A [Shouchella lonarensis]SDB81943.1 carbon starvation protein [Shouchella lonarensis]